MYIVTERSGCLLTFNRRTTSTQKACSVAQHHQVYQQNRHPANCHSFPLQIRVERPRHTLSQTDRGPCNAPKPPQLRHLPNSPFHQNPQRKTILHMMLTTPTLHRSLRLLVRLLLPTVVSTPTWRRSPSSQRLSVSRSHGNRKCKRKSQSGRLCSDSHPT